MASKFLTVSGDDERAIRRELRQFVSDFKYLDRRWDDLTDEHPGRWVGVYKRQAVFADSLEDVLAAATDKGWDMGGVVVRRLLKERPLMAL